MSWRRQSPGNAVFILDLIYHYITVGIKGVVCILRLKTKRQGKTYNNATMAWLAHWLYNYSMQILLEKNVCIAKVGMSVE